MKLFKSLLVAPALLGLLTPMTAKSTEINLDTISNYNQNQIDLDYLMAPDLIPLLAFSYL